MISVLVENYKKTLNPKSKWLESDLKEYKDKLSLLPIEKVRERYNKSVLINSKEYENKINSYIDKMDKNGMFNLKRKK